ncbi:MAG: hypothetical protein IIB39_02870 [Candidatus Marinimicrobia bacterium]|nr:hypothetical protein [Candidatus Neomarinimicrobiota bacterium]
MRLYHPLIFFVLFFSIPEINNAQITTRNFAISDDADLNDSYTSKSPKGALIRSLILPGWGQVYNRKFIKALVFLGGEFYFMSRYLKLDDELKTLEDTYNAGLASNTITGISALDIEDKEQGRNGWGWLFGAGYLLAMGDAFVDAHLDGISIDDEFSVKLISNNRKSDLSMQLQFNF